jgi:hypothetical protein
VAVEGLVVREGDLAALRRGEAGLDAPGREFLAEPGAVVAAVGDQGGGGRQGVENEAGAFVVAHLPFREQQDEGSALAITDRVELGVQAALGSFDTTGNSPFSSRLAAVRCAFRCVASIMTRSGLGPSPASEAKIRSNTPSRLQRTKQLCSVL